MTIRKTPHQIKEEIFSQLKEGPLSIKKLSEKIGSNWSTVNDYLGQLSGDGKVREIISLESGKYYIRTDYPVFYGLPLEKEKLENSLFLLSKIVERWNAIKDEPIAKTPLQKIAVEIVKNNSLDIPIVRFHYGKVLATYFEPENSQEIIHIYDKGKRNISNRIIDDEIKKHTNIAWQEKKEQYKKHKDMRIFLLSDRISYLISNDKTSNSKKISDLVHEILIEFPTGERYSPLFSKYHEFVGAINFIFNSKEFDNECNRKNYFKEILETFDSIWQALTTELFFEDIEPFIKKDFSEIVKFVKDSKIRTYHSEIDEKLNNLLDYKKSLTLKKIKLDEDEKKIFEILLEGVDEE